MPGGGPWGGMGPAPAAPDIAAIRPGGIPPPPRGGIGGGGGIPPIGGGPPTGGIGIGGIGG